MAHRAPEQSNTVTDVIAWLTPDRRRWLYAIITCTVPLLMAYGIFDQETAALWVALAASMLGTTVAGFHTPKPRE